MTHEPLLVSPAEAALLHMTRAVVGQLGSARAAPMLAGSAAPQHIGPTAARLLHQTLAAGTVLALARGGGWRAGQWLDGRGGVASGRLWERHPAPRLTFGPATVDTLSWLLGAGAEGRPKLSPRGKLHLGDELVLALAGDLLLSTHLAEQFFAQPLARRSGLLWLMHPLGMAQSGEACVGATLAPWTTAGGAMVVEALTPTLAKRHQAMFLAAPHFTEAADVIKVGGTVTVVLEAMLANRARPDLATFFVDACVGALDSLALDAQLAPSLSPRTSLGERSRAVESAGSWLRGLLRLQRLADAARGVSYIDDDYVASQLVLRRWEALSADRLQKAEALLGRLTQLDAAVSS